jgi:hypothetical protein
MVIINLKDRRPVTEEDYFSCIEEVLLATTSTPERLVDFIFWLSILANHADAPADDTKEQEAKAALKDAAQALCNIHSDWLDELKVLETI